MPTYRFDKPIIGITLGDSSGIGPEVVVRAVASLRARNLARYVIFADKNVVNLAVRKFSRNQPVEIIRKIRGANFSSNLLYVFHISSKHPVNFQKIHKPTKLEGLNSLRYIDCAVNEAISKNIDGIVTAPINKQSIGMAGFTDGGHTEYMAKLAGVDKKNVLMLFVYGGLRVGLVTRHIPVKDISKSLSVEKIFKSVSLTDKCLRDFMGIKSPNIYVSGLNPHAGDGGRIGDEEKKIIEPAIKLCRRNGILAIGPSASDSLFRNYKKLKADAVVCMYHDQALGAFKALAKDNGVNVSVGLPFIRTSVDHGTAFDMAWQARASYGSMVSAIKLCREMINKNVL